MSVFNTWKTYPQAEQFVNLFVSDNQAWNEKLQEGAANARNTYANTISSLLATGFVTGRDGTFHMLGEKGTKTASTTMWKEKGSSARIDVENPNPGERPGQLHYQDEKGTKYQYSVDDNKFYGQDDDGNFSVEAPKSVNGKLKDKQFQKGIDKGLKYLGEQSKFGN